MKSRSNKLIRITTVPLSLDLLLSGQFNFMNSFYEVTAISSQPDYLKKIGIKENIKTFTIEMSRKITPVHDLVAVVQLFLFFKSEKPLIVHSHTPKAGVLSMVAAKFAGVPIRLHTVAGLPLMESKGLKRRLLQAVEKLTYSCATAVYPNSKGLYDFILANEFTKDSKLKIISNGSSNGIDTKHYSPEQVSQTHKNFLRIELGIHQDDFVFVFVGRLVGDKGINEVVQAFKKVIDRCSNVKLLLVGMEEKDLDPLAISTQVEIKANSNILFVGYKEDIRPYLAISKALIFASYREGFPNVVMQAGAMGLASIVTDINGCNEIIVDQKNGIIIPVKNSEAIEKAVLTLVEDKVFCESLRSNSREMICSRYEQINIWNAILEEYRNLEEQLENVQEWSLYRNCLKPFFDISTAFFALIVLSPVLCVVFLVLFFSNHGSVFFFQKRPGKGGKLFTIIKFKTMNDLKDADGNLLPDAERLTTVGQWIRNTSLDELPQLLNVIKGEMSIVGPRPLLPEYLSLYTNRQNRRHNVKPGITGWAQVNGRNAISWNTKLEYDIWYTQKQSFALDVKIIFKTLHKVRKIEGINVANNPLVEPVYGK